MQIANMPFPGSFSEVAEAYPKRPPYSRRMLKMLAGQVQTISNSPTFADIGAGTGAIAYALADMGLSGYAVEPDREMLATGHRLGLSYPAVSWINAPGERTGLADSSVDWVCYGTSFHWINTSEALRECIRILRPHGCVTIANLLTDLETDPFHIEIENRIRDIAPGLRRARPSIAAQMETYEALLNQYPAFGNCISLASTEAISTSEERYVDYWASSLDIPNQVPPETWHYILQMIAEMFRSRQPASLRFRSTAWHAQRN
ncbi:methyltransferase domain-containing protein [Bradyrhizobium sp. B124]|uniref:class I SAM-dependent methyltransferase n=1 Tax=Bradyrhizobium sp. B124 TaxID=3140245 RepID=UPI0031845F93